MANTPPKRTPRAVPQTDILDYTDTPDLKPKPVRKTSVTKDVPVGKIVSTTLERRIAGTLSKATSMSMLNTVGENVAITANEAYNIWHPLTRMVGRRVPDVALKTNLSKPDADDVETIILTVIEYIARVIDGAFTRMYNTRIARITGKQQSMPMQTRPIQSVPVQIVPPPIEEQLEQFQDVTSGPDPDIAPMKNGGGSLAELIDRGYIPRDMGDNIA